MTRVKKFTLGLYTIALIYVCVLVLIACYNNGTTKVISMAGHQYIQTLNIQGEESAIKHSPECTTCHNIDNHKK